MKKVCRTCLNQTDKCKDIFKDSICDMLNCVTDLKVTVYDGLSEFICLKCARTVKKFYDFREKCHKSTEFLRSVQNEDEKPSITDRCRDDSIIKLEEDTFENYNDIKQELTEDCKIKIDDDSVEDDVQNGNDSDEIASAGESEGGDDKSDEKTEDVVCNVCKKQIGSQNILKRHMESHDVENPRNFVCEICFDAFHFNNKLLHHMRRHNNEKRYKCDKCSDKFFQLNALIRHLKQVHKTKKNLKCQECTKVFLLQRQLDHHLKLKHGIFKKVSCSQCNETFSTNCALKQHENKHTQFPCTMCNSRFSTKYILKAHLLKHTGDEKKVVCNICGKQYDPYYMPKHLKFHANDKPFKCSVCHKSFLTKSKLRYHTRTHTGEKPYMCTVCGNHFTCTATLKSHMLIHTGEKPFSCKICGRQFRQRSCLRTHMKIHSSD